MMKRVILIIFVLTLILTLISTISAINLDVSSKPISNTFILELEKPAIYELTLRNLEEKSDSFEIYSLVGIDIKHEPIVLGSSETKIARIELTPQESLRDKRDSPLTFEYKIRNSKNEIQKETLSINILDLSSVFSVIPERIHPSSESILINFQNNIVYDFANIKIKMSSIFFEHEREFSLAQKEKEEIVIKLDKEKLKTIDAGIYLMNTQVTVESKTANIESKIKFLEQEGIEATQSKEGLVIQRTEIIKKNIGNTKKIITITSEKNLLSYLFTTTNIPHTKVETQSFKKTFFWEKELIPNEEIKIIIRTNWILPILIIIIIIITIILIRMTIYSDLELKKSVSFVRTKGGQFALKISLKVRAKKFVERINIIDKLPPLVELYKKFGLIQPDKIDITNKRLEWNLPSLNRGESRIFSYIVYSKIGVVGRFELPAARAVYEHDGKIKEVSSNRSFYVHEPRKLTV